MEAFRVTHMAAPDITHITAVRLMALGYKGYNQLAKKLVFFMQLLSRHVAGK